MTTPEEAAHRGHLAAVCRAITLDSVLRWHGVELGSVGPLTDNQTAEVIGRHLYQHAYVTGRVVSAVTAFEPPSRALLLSFLRGAHDANSGTGRCEPARVLSRVDDDYAVVDWRGLRTRTPRRRIVDSAGDTDEVLLRTSAGEGVPERGSYLAYSNVSNQSRGPQARLYANVARRGLLPLVASWTSALNGEGAAFVLKVSFHDVSETRADSVVLYLAVEELVRLRQLLRDLVASLDARTTASRTPAWTRWVAPGAALATSPADGESFGLHRSRQLARALLDVIGAPASAAEVEARVQERCASQGWQLVTSHLAEPEHAAIDAELHL